MPAGADLKRALIEPENSDLSIRWQCELLGLNRSSYYLVPATESEEDLRLMRLIDQQFLRTPFEAVPDLESGLAVYFRFYDEERPHQSLGYRTPAEVYRAGSCGG